MNPCSASSTDKYKAIISQVCPKFEVDSKNKDLLNDIYRYANGMPGKLDTTKGLYFWGDIGTGKSTIMKIVAEFQRTMERGFKCANCAHLASLYATGGVGALEESTYNTSSLSRPTQVGNVQYLSNYMGANPVERGFDELGREPNPAKNYGNELNVMQYILQIRYDLRVLTHITTNLQPESLTKLYGSHIADRAFEMFNFIEMNGKTRRK